VPVGPLSAGRPGEEAGRPAEGGGPAADATRPDLVLVTMPFQHVQFPSLAVGLLKAILAREGFACRAVFANLRFADRLGVDTALLGEREWHASFFGDWLFQRALFPGAEMPAEEWVRDYAGSERLTQEQRGAVVASAEALRVDAEAFLDGLAAEIVEAAPAAVGCTITAPQLTASLALLRRVEELAPNVVTLAGGPGCEAGPGRALHEGVYAPWHRTHVYPEVADGSSYRGRVRSLAGLPPPDYDECFEAHASEPERLRYRLLHDAGRLVRHARCLRLQLPRRWPWAAEVVAGHIAVPRCRRATCSRQTGAWSFAERAGLDSRAAAS